MRPSIFVSFVALLASGSIAHPVAGKDADDMVRNSWSEKRADADDMVRNSWSEKRADADDMVRNSWSE
ncbi:hypothetical protein N7468_000926 [Penicillium chermesinum]|uniref:Uncharacterized protein n=1 Tax=Penicillium chermesinum TaxID=63820 RepID=A0A9W9PFL8_9EURO|nr:uncharacterized protein N7468_000926 [Penicillium chermesinum]KAJ5245943.1 hypothetical protein N7468_000926 [Penicillium chermesinum]KAJ6144239.1 hypothetical protein N7470_008134 [Penicillium chermesinum]